MSAEPLSSSFSVAAGDPNPSPQQLLEHAEETIALLRQKGMRTEVERDAYRNALRDIRAELSHGITANWDYIDRRFEVLDA